MNIADTYKEQPAPRVLYHYTSSTGLVGILESKCIWASAVHFLNDTREYTLALDLVESTLGSLLRAGHFRGDGSFVDKIRKSLSRVADVRVCVASFSEEGDLLNQWRAYCPSGKGFSIGFASEHLRALSKKASCFLTPCVYNAADQQAIIADLVKRFVARYNDNAQADPDALAQEFGKEIAACAAILKHDAFSEEREWRIICVPTDLRFKFRVSTSTIVPYRLLDLTSVTGNLDLEEIVIGPTADPGLQVRATTTLLLCSGAWCKIKTSRSPYRNW